MNKRTIITDNTEPPKNYLWHKLSPAGLDLGIYEYRDGKWNKIEIGMGSSEVEDDNWYYSLKDLEEFKITQWDMDSYADPHYIGEIDVTDQIISENKDKHYIVIPKNINDLGKENNTYSNDFRFNCQFNGIRFQFSLGNTSLNNINKHVEGEFINEKFEEIYYYSPIYLDSICKPFLFRVDNA